MRASIIRRSVPKAFLALVVTAAVGLSAETPLVWQNRGQMEMFNQTTRSFDFAVFAFDARTGELMRESVSDPSGLRLFDIAIALDGQGDRIFASGPIDSVSTILVPAFDAKTGGVLWEDRIVNGSHIVSARQLVAHGDLLFVGGGLQNSSSHNWQLMCATANAAPASTSGPEGSIGAVADPTTPSCAAAVPGTNIIESRRILWTHA